MAQTYKKVLLILLISCFTGIFVGCNSKIFHPFRRDKSGLQPTHENFRSYDVKKTETTEKKRLNRVERKINKNQDRKRREDLKGQEEGRKRHISYQTPKVQERMKKSFEESERTRKRKTFWQKLMFWKKEKSKEKRIK